MIVTQGRDWLKKIEGRIGVLLQITDSNFKIVWLRSLKFDELQKKAMEMYTKVLNNTIDLRAQQTQAE